MQGEPQDDQDETHDPVSATFIGLILGFTLVLVYWARSNGTISTPSTGTYCRVLCYQYPSVLGLSVYKFSHVISRTQLVYPLNLHFHTWQAGSSPHTFSCRAGSCVLWKVQQVRLDHWKKSTMSSQEVKLMFEGVKDQCVCSPVSSKTLEPTCCSTFSMRDRGRMARILPSCLSLI